MALFLPQQSITFVKKTKRNENSLVTGKRGKIQECASPVLNPMLTRLTMAGRNTEAILMGSLERIISDIFPELRNIGNPGLIKLLQQQIRGIYFYDLWKLSQIEVEIFLSLMIFSKKIIAGKGVENNND